jgi:hypothetical protein
LLFSHNCFYPHFNQYPTRQVVKLLCLGEFFTPLLTKSIGRFRVDSTLIKASNVLLKRIVQWT